MAGMSESLQFVDSANRSAGGRHYVIRRNGDVESERG